jgi:hypothetical protein
VRPITDDDSYFFHSLSPESASLIVSPSKTKRH